jgi:general secretion pathway protein A
LFTPEAVELVYRCSRGIPRLINQLCDTALVYGYSDQRPSIDAELMEEVVRDRLAGGIFPGRRGKAPMPQDAKPRVIRQS